MIALPSFTTGPDKEAFRRYLSDFNAVEDEVELLNSLQDCHDVMPPDMTALLYLPDGSTYRDAVQLLLASWSGTLRGGDGTSPLGYGCDR